MDKKKLTALYTFSMYWLPFSLGFVFISTGNISASI